MYIYSLLSLGLLVVVLGDTSAALSSLGAMRDALGLTLAVLCDPFGHLRSLWLLCGTFGVTIRR